jgi:pentatricopeptide repeat protein
VGCNSSLYAAPRSVLNLVGGSQIRNSLFGSIATYVTSTKKVSKTSKPKPASKSKKTLKKSVEGDSDEKGWFGIVRGDLTEEERLRMGASDDNEVFNGSNGWSESTEGLSEWELPEAPVAKHVLNFDSPLRGNFADLSAPVPLEGEKMSSVPVVSGESKLKASKIEMAPSASKVRRVPQPGDGIRDLLADTVEPSGNLDLGLDEVSKQVMMGKGATGGRDVISDYMSLKDMSDKEMQEAKEGLLPTPPLGSWEAEDLAARRVVDILTMPVYGPSPIYKGRNPNVFTRDEAKYFDKYPRTAKNYNQFIWSLCKLNDYEAALKALDAMKQHGIPRNVAIYTSLMQGPLARKDPREAIRLFVEMRKEGIAADLWVFDTMMEVFISAGQLDGAFALYDELKPNGLTPSTIIFTTLVKGCIRDNDLDRAWKVFHHMRVWHCEPDEVMMNLMIHACAVNSDTEKAMKLYEEMKQMDIRPTHVTFNSLLYACARRKDYYARAWELLKEMKVQGYIPDHRTLDMLLAVAGKGGDVSTAELIFDEAMAISGPPREQPYAFMIEAYAMAHRVHAEQHNRKKYVERAEQLFDRMVANGIRPTHLSLNMRLNLYTYNSMIAKSVEWKRAMKEVYHVKPDVYTYNSMIELYGRTRQMDLALDQFNLMKAEGLTPTFTTYAILIEGCTRGHLVTTGMKLIREMKAKDLEVKPEHTFIINFRRGLVKTPDLVREIDQITGKAYRFVMPWRRKGSIKKITYHRELTKEEAKRTSLYG